MRVKKEINIQIGERVKSAREHALLTQEQLAECIDVSPQYISDMERGVVGVSIPTLKKLCITLNVSSDRLLFDEKTEQRAAILAEKCSGLTDRQFSVFLEVLDSFRKAIDTE